MRRCLYLLSLITILTATPLRLAEAAEDLARSLSELGHGVNLEEVDGGVGDDSGATIKSDSADSPNAYLSVEFQPVLPATFVSMTNRGVFRSDEKRAGPSFSSARRCALLQRFLC